jgi:hypothetical protein
LILVNETYAMDCHILTSFLVIDSLIYKLKNHPACIAGLKG